MTHGKYYNDLIFDEIKTDRLVKKLLFSLQLSLVVFSGLMALLHVEMELLIKMSRKLITRSTYQTLSSSNYKI